MTGTSNSGRKKEFINPKTVIFYMEQEKYDRLIGVMKGEGKKVLSRYLNEILDIFLEE